LSEVLIQAERKLHTVMSEQLISTASADDIKKSRLSWGEFKSQLFNICRSGFIGMFIGAIPAAGGAISCWIARGVAHQFSKHPDQFGKGSLEGLAAPEAANSAVHGGSLIPLLTLGIPGNAPAAVLGAAFMMKGIVPGPLMFHDNAPIIYMFYASLFIINAVIFFHAKLWYSRSAQFFLKLPQAIIYSMVAVFCFLGTYLVNNSMFDVGTMLVMGIFGYFLRKAEFPIPAMVMAFLLGEMTENSFRQTLKMSGGGLSIFYASPISILFYGLTVLFLGGLVFRAWKKGKTVN